MRSDSGLDRSKLGALSKLGPNPNSDDVRSILKLVVQDWRPCPQLATAVLSGLGRQSLPTTCLEVLKGMEASQVQTDVIHYNSVLSACRSKWQAATYLLQRAARNHLQLQSLSFCLSFSAARAQPSAWQLCLSALHVDMPSLKVEADIRSFGAAIGACERGRWVEAGYLLEEMAQARLPGDVMSFSSGISACGEGAEWEAAMQVLPKMEHLQIVPDCVCINTLIGTYAGCVWPKAIESLRWLTSKRWSEAVSFNAAMKVVGSASFWELVLELMRQMTISAINPTLVSFNTAMAYVSWEVALCLLEDLKTAALKADEISLSQVLSSLSSASEWQKALELVEVGVCETWVGEDKA